MAKKIIEHRFTGPTTQYTSYDSTKTNLGVLIQQRTGSTALDKFAGPMPIGLARPMEASTAIASAYPFVIPWSTDIHWVFLADNATAAATRRIILYEFNRTTSTFAWKGFIILTFPTATAHTIRGFRMSYDLYTTGTVEVDGTAVTGTGTLWADSRLASGCRIGFGSTNPNNISTWYEISSIGSNTAITLTASAGTISAGSYVIEDLRAIVATTNATTTNGGLFIAKGLCYQDFTPSGTTIPSAITTDNITAVYWLADATTVTNTISCGAAIQSKISWSEQYVFIIDGTTTTNRVYKYNVRAALTLTNGKATNAFVLVTGTQTPTGTCSQANNGRIGTLNHGPGNGVESLYFVTTTRVYRAALTNITSGNTTWQSDAMTEVPPGGTSTYAVTNVMSSVEIAGTIDRLVTMTTGAAGVRSYVTQYNTVGNPFDHIFLVDDKQLDQSSADSGGVAHPAIIVIVMSAWAEDGILYLCRNSTAAATNQIYAIPLGAHWTYAGSSPNQRLITPALSTFGAVKYSKAFINEAQQLGSLTMGLPPEPYRVYYRTTGITDDSGTWTLLDDTRDLSGVDGAESIQFMFEFKIIGTFCIPARIYSVGCSYEDSSTDSHYEPSVGKSDITKRIFAYRQSVAWGENIPNMRIRIYNASTGVLILDDTTEDHLYGTWEYSTNGTDWLAWDNTQDVVGNYVRYTANSLPEGIVVRALLTTV